GLDMRTRSWQRLLTPLILLSIVIPISGQSGPARAGPGGGGQGFQTAPASSANPVTTQRILQEGKYQSQVMQLLKELTDNGPRLRQTQRALSDLGKFSKQDLRVASDGCPDRGPQIRPRCDRGQPRCGQSGDAGIRYQPILPQGPDHEL